MSNYLVGAASTGYMKGNSMASTQRNELIKEYVKFWLSNDGGAEWSDKVSALRASCSFTVDEISLVQTCIQGAMEHLIRTAS